MTASSATTPGKLYIVATPIGNLTDMSERAIKTLQSVDLILAEDTRHSQPLLTALGIKKPMRSLHAHNEASQSEQFIFTLLQGQSLALISDAGTPLISDPGFPLVKLAHEKNISVVPIPGACALIAALSAAGVSCDTFTFAGFLPAKQIARCQKLEKLKSYEHTLVFYESTHRILECIKDIAAIFGETTEIVLAKELTKSFERFISGNFTHIMEWLQADKNHIKGEFVLILPPRAVEKDKKNYEDTLSILLAELPLKQAVKITSQLTKANKNELYKIALDLQK
ncbi:16S rRNA (cytidine(1402)-2'-O)-methyltransferase [Legionella nagasakiensis]|uniref:16S rRNA (cytidine(1402)-2'-O)-methyltransferase n=1 Tax=Legionella nagasakiensis TaxID=535290 RepID=UPI00105645FE|nr:16S rRNA (cytidine(1402)-2'-O)-methyltransferase [Legionella nagasakiensis]